MRRSSERLGGRKSSGRIGIYLAIGALILGAVLLVLFLSQLNSDEQTAGNVDRSELVELWRNGNYARLISAADRILEERPMDGDALVLGGFARFYNGVNLVDTDQRRSQLEESVAYLRRARLLERPPLGGELYYVLGKAYFHRGRFYTDSAIRALERSLELEYRAEDSFEYLGLAYSRLGLFDEAVEYFLRSAEENPSDILFLTVAQTYYEDGRLEPALEYAERAIERTDDDFLAERARFLIGEVYLDLESYGDAERFFQSILENNPRSAQAHVLLGEIYSRRGDDVRARDAWREALRLDPNNVEAWERLN